MISGERK